MQFAEHHPVAIPPRNPSAKVCTAFFALVHSHSPHIITPNDTRRKTTFLTHTENFFPFVPPWWLSAHPNPHAIHTVLPTLHFVPVKTIQTSSLCAGSIALAIHTHPTRHAVEYRQLSAWYSFSKRSFADRLYSNQASTSVSLCTQCGAENATSAGKRTLFWFDSV